MKGIINLNKPSGISSAAAVSKVRRFLGVKAAGHMGTLDPLASGVLLVGVGKACRLFDFFLKKDKRYSAVFEFGVETDTLDCTGTTVRQNGYIPTIEEIRSVLPEFVGKIEQIPPQYSAKSVNGQRAYKIARGGGSVQLKPVPIEIFGLEFVEQLSTTSFRFDIHCSSGTYIRSIARDIAYRLNTYGSMTQLERTTSGKFSIEQSVSLEELEQKKADCLTQIDYALRDLPRIDLDKAYYKQITNGVKIKSEKAKICNDKNLVFGDGELYTLFCDDELIGIASINSDGYIKIGSYLKD